jgi:hypothetical protein
MDNRDYHSILHHISSSSLKYAKRPKKLQQYLEGTMPRKEEKYFQFGTLFHMFILERKRFDEEVAVQNYTVPRGAQQKKFVEDYVVCKGKVDERLLEAYRNNYVTKEPDEKVLEKAKSLRRVHDSYVKYLNKSKRKTVITPKVMQQIEDMYAALHRHKAAYKLLCTTPTIVDSISAHSETMFLWEKTVKGDVPMPNIQYKALVDRIIVDEETKVIKLVDLKTIVDMDNYEDDYEKYNYGIQLAFYSLAILEKGEKVLGLEHPIDDYKLEILEVVVDKTTSEVKVIKFNDAEILYNFKKLKGLLDLVEWHYKNNKWEYSREYYEGDGTETF